MKKKNQIDSCVPIFVCSSVETRTEMIPGVEHISIATF